MLSFNRFNEPCITYGQMNLVFSIRNLWRELSTWSRAFMISYFYGLELSNEVFTRLYEIPQEFGNILSYFFGYDLSVKFVDMISRQIVLFRTLIEALLNGDTAKIDEITRQLYQLADQRAAFMHEMNPFWDETESRNLIYAFYDYSIEEARAILSRNYSQEIDIYDRLLHHADAMGDFFTQGLFQYMTMSQEDNNRR